MSLPGPNSSPNHSPIGSQSQNNSKQDKDKGTIERGASWSYNETRILLSFWGQDMVQRQLTNSKRTRHVWEKIAERIREHGYERTPDQVRTRVFNMIAEYRRILKNPTPERKKKCIFFDALHRIYQAKDANGVRAALNYTDEECSFYNDNMDFTINDETNDGGMADGGDGENSGTDNEEIFAYQMSPSQLNGPSGINGSHNHAHEDSSDGLNNNEEFGVGRNPAKRARAESTTTSYHQYSTPQYSYNSYDGSLAVLIDRMFCHLSKETDVMKDWIKLEKERINRETLRRKEEHEREERREKAFLETLMKMQEQTFTFLSAFTGTKSQVPTVPLSSSSTRANIPAANPSNLMNKTAAYDSFTPSSDQSNQVPSSSFNMTDTFSHPSLSS